MITGTVKMWDAQKGFGFIIRDDDDEDIFVNISDVMPPLKNQGLREGMDVKFDVRSDMKGDKAVNVRQK